MRGRLTLLAIVLGLLAGTISDARATVRLESESDLATAGYFRLRWQGGEAPVRLVESLDSAFETRIVIYEGPDTARMMSGKSDGQYFYRLERAGPANTGNGQAEVISNSVSVTVRHHSLGRALVFFVIGAAVFTATLALVLLGDRHERRQ